MNATMFVAPHPYYAVTDESGRFELTQVPPGQYELVAWHEGWKIARNQPTHDVLTEHTVARPIFTEAKTWQQPVTVGPDQTVQSNFLISEK
jgi:hypothetical protein